MRVVALVATLTLAAPLAAAGGAVAATDTSTTTTTTTTPAPAASARSALAGRDLARMVASLLNGLFSPPRTVPVISSTTTTTTTVDPCRNSTDPACGPFRFDPQPAPDRPMSLYVTATPATVTVGQPMVFRLMLVDPDGVSHNASRFIYGDSGIIESNNFPCTRYGPWDPPAPDPLHAVEVQEIVHTYFNPGTWTATFDFYPDPFDCVDSVTGRSDRPYASPASASVTVVVIAGG